MKENQIPKRHRRLLSSLLFVLEQKTEAIEHMVNHSAENASYSIEQDLPIDKKKAIGIACDELRESISQIAHKLKLPKRKISQSQYISTMQSQMWENVSDAYSDKLKGYGKEVVAGGKQADPLIQLLANQIDKLKI